MSLRKDGGMFILDMWIWVPTSRSKTESCSDFARQRYNLHSEDLGSPCSALADKQVAGGGCKEIMSHDEDIPTLNVDGEAPEEEMECEPEDETVQDAERVRTISDPGQPSKKEREKARGNTCAVQKLVHCMCERTWNHEAPQEHWYRK